MHNRKPSNHNAFTTRLIELVKQYVPEEGRYRILKQFKEKSIKEQLAILEIYIENKLNYAPKEEELITYNEDGSYDPDIFTMTYKKEALEKKDISKEKIMKIEEINKNKKFQSEFNKIKNQYTRFFTTPSSILSCSTQATVVPKSVLEMNQFFQSGKKKKNALASSSASNNTAEPYSKTEDHKPQSSAAPESTIETLLIPEASKPTQVSQQGHFSNNKPASDNQSEQAQPEKHAELIEELFSGIKSKAIKS